MPHPLLNTLLGEGDTGHKHVDVWRVSMTLLQLLALGFMAYLNAVIDNRIIKEVGVSEQRLRKELVSRELFEQWQKSIGEETGNWRKQHSEWSEAVMKRFDQQLSQNGEQLKRHAELLDRLQERLAVNKP
jgi:exopolyphosphatase/pppGpp-phosphohydrolase